CRATGTMTCVTWSGPGRTSASWSAPNRTRWPGGRSPDWPPTRTWIHPCGAWPANGWPAAERAPASSWLPRSVQDAGAQGAFDGRQFALEGRDLGLVGAHVDHHVADLRVGAQELAVDVDRVAAEDVVDLGQHAGDVAVDVQQAQAALVLRQGDLGEVHRRQGAAVVAVAHQLGRHLHADVLLRLQRAAADVRGQDHVVEAG